jgi:hypothetical protein
MKRSCERQGVVALDEHTFAIFLIVPPREVVLLQSIFELYEGVGTVRTLEVKRSLTCIITTKELLSDCLHILDQIHTLIDWTAADPPLENDAWIGYRRKGVPGVDGATS